jgi:uncharacterized coiled-coil protein SlyX
MINYIKETVILHRDENNILNIKINNFWKFLTIGLMVIILFFGGCIFLFKTYIPTKKELKEIANLNSASYENLKNYIEKDSGYAKDKLIINNRFNNLESSIISQKKDIENLKTDILENRTAQEKISAKLDVVLSEIKRKN